MAARAAAPGAASHAIDVVLGGGMLANVVGVPVGAFAGQVLRWRGPFWVPAVLSIPTALLVLRLVSHNGPQSPYASVRAEVAAMRGPLLWLVLLSCVLLMGGRSRPPAASHPCSSIAPVCQQAAAADLAGLGVGALARTLLGGRLGNRHAHLTSFTGAACTASILDAMCALPGRTLATVVLVGLWGLAAMTVVPVLVSLSVRLARDAPTLASAMASALFNPGHSDRFLDRRNRPRLPAAQACPPLVGTVIATLALVPLGALGRRATFDNRRPSTT